MIELHLSDRVTAMGSRAVMTWPSLGAPHLTDYLEVEIHCNHRGVWWVQGWLDFRFSPDLSWGVTRVIDGREAAAQEAADIWAEGVRLVLAYHRGEPMEPPGVRMREAWHVGAGAEIVAALDAVRARRVDHDNGRGMFARTWANHEPACRAYDVELSAYLRETDWRAFRAPDAHRDVKPESRGPASQLSLLEVA